MHAVNSTILHSKDNEFITIVDVLVSFMRDKFKNFKNN